MNAHIRAHFMKHLLVLACHVCSIKAKTANKALVYSKPFTAALYCKSANAKFHFTRLDTRQTLLGKIIDTYRNFYVHSKL